MKIIKILLYTLLIISVFIACEKERHENYEIKIKGVSSKVVRIDDTISVYVDWLNSELTTNIKFGIDESIATIISVEDTIIRIKIPYGLERGEVTIEHPNGAEVTWCCLEKENYPIVYNISTLEGKAGDLITISGRDFLFSPRVNIKINTQDCEIKNINDSVIVFTVPEYCGNGQIQIQYWNRETNYCVPDIEKNCGKFNYHFTKLNNKKVVSEYNFLGLNYKLERNTEGRVIKRIITSLTHDYYSNRYERFSYNASGLVDSVLLYNNDEIIEYSIFSRNNNNSHIEIDFLNENKKFKHKEEYHFLNDRVIQVNFLMINDGLFYIRESLQYEYEGEFSTELRRTFETNGDVRCEESSIIKYDVFNGYLPDLGIPGYIQFKFHQWPILKEGYAAYKSYYNEYGQLEKVERYNNCSFDKIQYSFTYKEQ